MCYLLIVSMSAISKQLNGSYGEYERNVNVMIIQVEIVLSVPESKKVMYTY